MNHHEASSPDGLGSLVTVVIPCYNAVRYLAESIESVLAQTYANIEIIVVDDGSSDGSADIARSYPVSYIYRENGGASAARNAGIQRSRGKYLLFLDADDRLLPEAVAIGVALLEAHAEFAIAVGEHRYIRADGAGCGFSNKAHSLSDPSLMLLEHNFIEAPCSALHRASCLAKTGVFDEALRVGEDHEFYLRTARSYPIVRHQALVAEYRIHDANTSRNAELMLAGSHRVLEMEWPHIQGDRDKLRFHRKGVAFVGRHFGRRLTRELIGSGASAPDRQRKLALLRLRYPAGWVLASLGGMLPGAGMQVLLRAWSRLRKSRQQGQGTPASKQESRREEGAVA